jgi:hypothetical protein
MAKAGSTGADGRVVFMVEADDSKLDSGLKSATKKIEKEAKKWSDAGKDNAGIIDTAFGGLLETVSALGEAFGKMVVQFISDGIELASSVKEVDDTINSVFGSEGAQKIDSWSRTLVSKLGLSELQAKKYASSIGLIARNAGLADDEMTSFSQSVVGMAADFASSIPGMSSETAFNAILQAFQGKGTALSKYGFDMSATAMKAYAESQGAGKWADLSAQQQLNLRYQKMFDQMQSLGWLGAFEGAHGQTGQAEARLAGHYENAAIAVGKPLEEIRSSLVTMAADVMDMIMGVEKPISGSKEDLEAYLGTLEEALPAVQAILDESIAGLAEKYGYGRENFVENGLYGSYGEWAVASLQDRMRWERGENKQELTTVLPMFSELSSAVASVQGEIYGVQQDLQTLEDRDASAALQAKAAAEAQAIADGYKSKYSEVSAAVERLNAIMAQLGSSRPGATGTYTYIPHASGLDYVPYDNYRAALHEGESVLTAQEAKVWRAMKFNLGNQSNLNYDALGGVMRENVRTGGNVYLDGQSVGRVISARQADSYRAMERSGFQQ